MNKESFHFEVSIISRGKGKSAVASAAYISCEKIKNEWDAVVHDYTRKTGVLEKDIILPEHVPKEFKDRTYLWNKVEQAEKNSNAQLARQFIIALPKELILEENKKLVEEFIKTNLTSEGMIVDYAIHDESKENNGNIHCHILSIVRPINKKGEFTAKSKKEYLLDDKGNKILNKNGKPKTRKVELTTWNDKGNVEKWRESFSNLCNKYLEKNNIEKRVDHRSFKRQNSDYLPTIHMGAAASALERKGIETDKGNYNKEIKKYNELVKSIKEQTNNIKEWITNYIKELTTAYKEYKEKQKIEIKEEPKLFNLYEYISTYSELQKVKRKYLPRYAENKKTIYDLKKLSKAYNYLKKNNIYTIADLQKKIQELKSKSYKLNGKAKETREEIEKIEKKLLYYEIYKDNKDIFDEYKKKTVITRDSFFKKHQGEIEKFQRAKNNLQKLMGSDKKLEPKKWQEEKINLTEDLKSINAEKEKIKEEYQDINHIKYSVEVVNEELGIDLSIEIDKLIKQGEKPSTIAQIEKFKEQLIKDREYKEMMKNKKIEQER